MKPTSKLKVHNLLSSVALLSRACFFLYFYCTGWNELGHSVQWSSLSKGRVRQQNKILIPDYNIHTKIALKLAPKGTTSTVSGTLVILCWDTCHLLLVYFAFQILKAIPISKIIMRSVGKVPKYNYLILEQSLRIYKILSYLDPSHTQLLPQSNHQFFLSILKHPQ